MALVGLVIEFLQITSFNFNRTLPFSGLDLTGVNYVAVPIGDSPSDYENFFTIYWVMFAVSFTPYIFVIVVRVVISAIGRQTGGETNILAKLQEKIHSILWFLVNTLYFPVIGSMLFGLDCTFRTSSITLDANPAIECLTGKHIALIVCSMIALIIYYPAASLAQAQTQSVSDIKFKPRMVFIMLQGKFVLMAIAIFFSTHYVVYFITCISINIIFLVLNIIGKVS